MFDDLSPNVAWALVGIYAILVVASVVTFALVRLLPGRNFHELVLRVQSWWVMVTLFSLAMVLSRRGALVFLGFVSFLALKEYLSLIPTRRTDRRVLLWAYLAIPVQYYWVAAERYGFFIIWVPVYMFLLLPAIMIVHSGTQGFLRAAGSLHWGLMACVFSLSHAAFLLVLPDSGNPVAGGAGWLLFLVFLTQANDVGQYLWGKALGRTKAAPEVSPGKTVEGFLGGLGTTTVLALAIAPLLTPFDWRFSAVAGLIIGFSGFIGDVTISAIKRDLGVKDSGSLLPGHGGILDRVDSLTYTAPLFFHYVYYFYY
ncbi:MAG: phosphatidate cytidylyltransferase [Rhodospirillaceae bacterium]|nr:phosphatidate cytidylyltransferase [Rhodospirillaceae bacterium]